MAVDQTERQALAIEVIAVPNMGAMRDQPTNAVIVGQQEVLIIDPGEAAGVALIEAALARRGPVRVQAIVLTHGHHDHVIAAPALKARYDCPILLNPIERTVLHRGLTWEEVDRPLTGGMVFTVDGGHLETLDTPGHSPGHVALFEPASRTLIAGDLVSGNGTVGIFPPLGKMGDYVASLRRAQEIDARTIIPGHGPTIVQPPDLFARYLARRLQREEEIAALLRRGPATIEAMLPELYPDVLPQFQFAAMATILAHLEKLREEGRAAPDAADPLAARWSSSAVDGD